MITNYHAFDKLARSIDNLKKRRGTITNSDIETEVINNACLTFLQARRDRGDKDWNARRIDDIFVEPNVEAIPYAKAFIMAAMKIFPVQYGEAEAAAALRAVTINVSWEGMWPFLMDYFQKYHGINIDENSNTPLIFYSNRHKRFENGILVKESEAERTLNVYFINEFQEVVVSIEPTLSPKTGYLTQSNDSIYQYKGADPDYEFTIEFDEFKEIETLTLEMPKRALKIIYS
jgi:hypothetical protein